MNWHHLKSSIAALSLLAIVSSPPSQAAPTGSLTEITGNAAAAANVNRPTTPQPICEWQPAGKPQAVAILVHGITANAQCLSKVANALVSDGVLTYGLDLRGHGSWYARLAPGTTGRKCNYQASVGDLDRLVMQVRAKHPGLPLFLIGESVGAAVSLRSAVDCSSMVDGVVLCAPGSRCASANPLWILGDLCRAITGHKIDLTRYQNKYATEDQAALKEMEHGKGIRTVYSASELLGTVHFIHKNPLFARELDPHVPVLVLQGNADKTIRPRSARRLFANLPSKQKFYVGIPNCGHVLLATPRVKKVVTDSIVGFINMETSHNANVAANANGYE